MIRATLALLGAALVSACATVAPPVPPLDETGALSGRLTLKVEAHDDQPSRSINAIFDLRGDARRGELNLTTPLGTTLARARWQPGEAMLSSSQGEQRHPDLPSLAEAAFGERIPLQALLDWLHGQPWEGAPSQPLASGQRGFEQLGWTVDLARYQEGWVNAVRSAPPAVNLRAKLDQPS